MINQIQRSGYWRHCATLVTVALLVGAIAIGCSDDDDDNPVDPPALPVSIVGSWGAGYNSGSDTYGCCTLYPSGYFIYWDSDGADLCDSSGGVEIGTYTYNASTKTISYNCILDENGCHGLADNGVSYAEDFDFVIRNDSLLGYEDGQLDIAVARIGSASDPIVGGWGVGHYTDHFPEYYSITFYANGIYILWRSDDPTASCDAAGVEIGTYTYTAASDELVINSVLRDDNGCGGFAVDGAEENPGDWTIRVVIDGDQLTAYEDGTTVSFVGPRVR